MKIDRVDHLVINARDVEQTCEFYQRVLGMEVRAFPPKYGKIKALHFGSQKFHVHQSGEEPYLVAGHVQPGSQDFCLISSDPMDGILSHLAACGVEIVEGPIKREGAVGPINSVYFRDPDGNLVEVSNELY